MTSNRGYDMEKALDVLKNVPKATTVTPAVGIAAAQTSLDMLVGAWRDCRKTALVEGTKREYIAAWRENRLKELENQGDALELYLKGTFLERAMIFEGLFGWLNSAVETGNDGLLEKSIDGILTVAGSSPLREAAAMLNAMKSKEVEVIDI